MEQEDDTELLTNACLDDDIDLVRQVLARGHFDVDKAGKGRLTPLCMACALNHTGIAKCLIDHGANEQSDWRRRNTTLYGMFQWTYPCRETFNRPWRRHK